jgi:hypothetical protein
MSSERHTSDEIVCPDIGRVVIVSPVRECTPRKKPDSRAPKVTDHVYLVQALVYFYRSKVLGNGSSFEMNSHLDNVSALVDQSHCLGGPVPERSGLHTMRSIAHSKMLEGTPNFAD